MRIAPLLLTAAVVCAQSPYDILARARRNTLASASALPNYTCVQTLQREYFRRSNSWPACEGVDASHTSAGAKGTKLERWSTDRYRLDVRVSSDGRELYSWAGGDRFDAGGIEEIVGAGAATSGSFGPFLLNIFGEKGVDFTAEPMSVVGGRELLPFRYRVPQNASRYDFKSAGMSHFIPFEGIVWIDPASSEVVRLDVQTAAMPHSTGVCEAATSIELRAVSVAGENYPLPSESTIEISALSGRYVNHSAYSSCREFSTESNIRFDADSSMGPTKTVAPRRPLPRGLRLSLALDQQIDMRTAAAGDVVRARVTRAVTEKNSKKVIVPVGAIAEGRIVCLDHQWASPKHFLVAIDWQRFALEKSTIPFTAVLDSSDNSFTVRVADLAQGRPAPTTRNISAGRAFLFLTADEYYVVPRGYTSKWVTR